MSADKGAADLLAVGAHTVDRVLQIVGLQEELPIDGVSPEPWSVVSKSPVLTVKNRKVGSIPVLQWIGEGEFQYPAEALYRLLTDTVARSKWDTVFAEYRSLHRLSESTDITYSQTKPLVGGMISARDYIDLRVCRVDASSGRHIMVWADVEASLVSALGADVPEVDPTGKIVRGFNHPGGIVIVPRPDGKSCFVHYTVHSDIKGTMPVWLVNKGTGGAIDSIFANLKKALKAQG
ncbi:hypothetical protein DFJ73DRAFT_821692 [Zopfochytrium polystomum]|nr:hypothetical protein DFJ73DRAFT_821692 [Zopfochytrium polystomum]